MSKWTKIFAQFKNSRSRDSLYNYKVIRFPLIFTGGNLIEGSASELHVESACVVKLWRQTTTKIERIQISVGSSAKDFVMVLSYGRKSCYPGKFPNICTHLKNDVQQEIK